MKTSRLQSLLSALPNVPGVYKFKDEDGRILYVGKAKNLSKRVKSYFVSQKNRSRRTEVLISKVRDIEWIEVGSDFEALMLETNLIKELRPKYNVLMKDDKNFVYIKITYAEDFPRIKIVRKVEDDGSKYFGPKSSAQSVKKTLLLLQKLFQYRSCDLGIEWKENEAPKISNKNIAYPCLDYHIKRCAAPCIGACTPEEYAASLKKIEYFLSGKTEELEADLNAQIQACVVEKKFERAAILRDKLLSVKSLSKPQIVSEARDSFIDIMDFTLSNDKAYINLFLVRHGKLLHQENFIAEAHGFEAGDESDAHDVVESFLYNYYSNAQDIPDVICVPLNMPEKDFFEEFISQRKNSRVVLHRPQRGGLKALLDMSKKNAVSFMKQDIARWMGLDEDSSKGLEALKDILQLKKLPTRIECYDISHLSGTDTVASMVVFKNAKASSADYRHFKLKSLISGEIDDFKSIEEVLMRRLSYLSRRPYGLSFKINKEKCFVSAKSKSLELARFYFQKPTGNGKFCVSAYTICEQENAFDLKFKESLWSAFLSYAKSSLKLKKLYILQAEAFHAELGFKASKEDPDLHMIEIKTKTDASFSETPDLILIDGGKGQLSAALKAREVLNVNIPMISLAKKNEDIYIPGSSSALFLPKSNPALKILQAARDEAHRFAIELQRKNREKYLKINSFDEISGLGDKGKMKLLKHFGSPEQIKKASFEEISQIVGESLAEKIKEAYSI